MQVAELILRATQGPPKFKHYEVSHKDNDCTNNHPDNLRWESKRGNLKRYHEQNGYAGWCNPNAKIMWFHEVKVHEMLASGRSQSDIARALGVHPSTISRLTKRLKDDHKAKPATVQSSGNPFSDETSF